MDNIEFKNENVINANPRFMYPLSFSGVCRHTAQTHKLILETCTRAQFRYPPPS